MTKTFLALLCLIALFSCGGSKPEKTEYYHPKEEHSVASEPPPAYYREGEDVLSESSPPESGEKYNHYSENKFVKTSDQPVSTFSVDADGASYTNIRRFLSVNQLPPPDAVRIEEMINYFDYDYPEPTGELPIGLEGEVTDCPWQPGDKLVRIGIKGKSTRVGEVQPYNLVLLIDISGSMESSDKLPLLQKGLIHLADQLGDKDHIAIVTYAGSSRLVLPPTNGNDKSYIKSVIWQLQAGGGTAGANALEEAYRIAHTNYAEGSNNRVILCTDGDFNIGPSSQAELVKLIKTKRESGIFLSVFGVGQGNLNDAMMEQIADHGNGTYEYIDSEKQAEKVFFFDYGKLAVVAKDVKVQVSFNPEAIASYRLIGYENRKLANKDFEDDAVDAGEVGAGQSITALYQIQPKKRQTIVAANRNCFKVDFRYKSPESSRSTMITLDVPDRSVSFEAASYNTRFAVAVAAFGMKLKGSTFAADISAKSLLDWASPSRQYDQLGYRKEFTDLLLNYIEITHKLQ